MPQNITFLYPTKLVGYQYVRKKMLKNPPTFLEENKTYFFGIRAHMPIFEP